MNVERQIVPNKLVKEVCDLVPQKPGIQSVYWIGVVEVEGDVVVKCATGMGWDWDVIMLSPVVGNAFKMLKGNGGRIADGSREEGVEIAFQRAPLDVSLSLSWLASTIQSSGGRSVRGWVIRLTWMVCTTSLRGTVRASRGRYVREVVSSILSELDAMRQ